jgi:hypothetical protein
MPSHSSRLLVVPVLAALAVAGCGGSSSKGSSSSSAAAPPGAGVQQDAQAKADARNVETLLETCFTDHQTYTGCGSASRLRGIGGQATPALGTGRGQVEVAATASGYTITAHSESGNSFTVAKGAAGTIALTCRGQTPGGCHGGSW